jgi:hypothetical protein
MSIFQSEDEMIENAKGFMGKLLLATPNLVATLMPLYNDMIPSFTEYKLSPRLAQAEPRIKIEIMRDRLPTHLGLQEMENWFNVPHDAHYSDRGGDIYARTMAGLIAERITGTELDFSKTPSKYSSEVLGPNKPRLRKIVNSLSRLADAPDKVAEIKNYIHEKMIKGKVSTFYLYSLNRVLGNGSDGLTIPFTKPLTGDFQKIAYGPDPNDVVYLNVMCTSKPISLRNPACYHLFHMFAR